MYCGNGADPHTGSLEHTRILVREKDFLETLRGEVCPQPFLTHVMPTLAIEKDMQPPHNYRFAH